MPENSNDFVNKSYNLIKNAYPNEFNITQEQYIEKIKDPVFKEKSYNLIKKAYSNQFNVDINNYTSKIDDSLNKFHEENKPGTVLSRFVKKEFDVAGDIAKKVAPVIPTTSPLVKGVTKLAGDIKTTSDFKNDPANQEYLNTINKNIQDDYFQINEYKKIIADRRKGNVDEALKKFKPELYEQYKAETKDGNFYEDKPVWGGIKKPKTVVAEALSDPNVQNYVNGSDTKAMKISEQLINDYSQIYDRYQDAIKRGIVGNLIKGVGEDFVDYYVEYGNLTKTLSKNTYIKDLITRIDATDGKDLTTDEALLLNTMLHGDVLAQNLQSVNPLSREVGGQMGQSFAFMTEFIATSGGLTKVAGAGLRTLGAAEKASKITKLTANIGAKLAESGVQTLKMPSFYKQAALNVTDPMKKDKSNVANVWEAYYKTVAGNISERLFEGKLVPGGSTTKFGRFLERSSSALAGQRGIKGISIGTIEEMGEEKFEEVLTGMYDYDYSKEGVNKFFKEFTDVDQNLKMVLSVGLTTVTMGLANEASGLKNKRVMNKYGSLLNPELKEYIDKQIVNENNTPNQVLKDVTNYVQALYKTDKLNEKDAIDTQRKAMKYASIAVSDRFREDITSAQEKIDKKENPEGKPEGTKPETKQAEVNPDKVAQEKEIKTKEITDFVSSVSNKDGNILKVKTSDGKEYYINPDDNITDPENPPRAISIETQEPVFIDVTSIEKQDVLKADDIKNKMVTDIYGEEIVAKEEVAQPEKEVTEIKVDNKTVLPVIKNEDNTYTVGDVLSNEKEANKLVDKLNLKYTTSTFSVVDETDSEDQFAEGQFKIIATPNVEEVQDEKDAKEQEVVKRELKVDAETKVDVIQNKDGSFVVKEMFDDKKQADGLAKKLSSRYPKSDFEVISDIDKTKPFAESKFKIVAKSKQKAEPIKEGSKDAVQIEIQPAVDVQGQTSNGSKVAGENTETKGTSKESEQVEEKVAPERPTIEGEQLDQWVLDNSNDPQEIYSSWVSQKQNAPINKVSTIEEQVLTHKINKESFINASGKEHLAQGIAKQWLTSDKNRANQIDVIAQDISETTGKTVTPNDIVNIVLKYPDGMPRKTTNIQNELATKYKNVVGENIDKVKPAETKDENDVPFRKKDAEITDEVIDRDSDERKEFVAEVISISQDYAEKLNTKIKVIENEEQLPEHIKSDLKNKGYENGTVSGALDTKNDEVYLLTDNLSDAYEAEVTILHEVVSHKGLRALLGDKFSSVMQYIYDSMSKENIARISELYNTKDSLSIADEYLGEFAENDIRPSFINRAIAKIKAILRKLFDIKYTDVDIQELLSRSKEYLTNSKNTIVKEESIVYRVRQKLTPTEENDITNLVRDALEKEPSKIDIKEQFKEVREAIQDKDLPINALEKEVLKRGGIRNDNMKTYRDKNQSGGRIEALWKDVFINTIRKPLYDAIFDLHEQGMIDADIMGYVIAKHTVERNNKIRNDKLEEYKKTNKTATKEQIKLLEDKLAIQDFSGIMSLNINDKTGELKMPEYKDRPDAFATDLVAKYESKYDFKDFSERINAATTFTLDRWLESHQITQEQYDQFKKDYKYYVPLRGWYEAADKYLNYHTGKGSSSSLKQAKGRPSLPDNPLVYIESMAFQSIAEQVTNEVNQTMLNFVAANLTNNKDLFNVKKIYYLLNENTNEWEPTLSVPTKEQLSAGIAKSEFYDEYQRLRKPTEASEHEVWVNTSTGTFAIIFPEKQLPVAQALNNQNTLVKFFWMENALDVKDINNVMAKTIGRGTNLLKQLFTSWNIIFPATNFSRDWTEALTYILISKDAKQTEKYVKTLFTKSFKTVGTFIYKNDKFDPANNKYHKHLQDFRFAGGITGYTHSKSTEQIAKDIAYEYKKLTSDIHIGNTLDAVERVSQLFEDSVRFSVFVSARESGMTVKDAAAYAKEATINFDRKGKMSKAFDSAYAFFNVATQGTQKNIKIAKDYTKRFATAAAVWTLLGLMMSEMNRLVGGDDDKYDDINEWVRQNYLIFPVGDSYVRIPLPQFFRAFYSFGVLGSDFFHGKKKAGEASTDAMINLVSSLSPIDPGGFVVDGKFSIGPLVPTVFKPMYEISQNRDYTGATISKEAFTKDIEETIADARMGKENVNPIIKFVTESMFMGAGGRKESDILYYYEDGEEKTVREAFDWNPSKIEHLIKGYTGGVGKIASDLTTTMIQSVMPEDDIDINNVPLVNSFIRKYPEKKWRYIREFYEMEEDVKEHFDRTKSYTPKKEGDDVKIFNELSNKVEYSIKNQFITMARQSLDNEKMLFEQNERTTKEFLDKRSEIIESTMKNIDKAIKKYEENNINSKNNVDEQNDDILKRVTKK